MYSICNIAERNKFLDCALNVPVFEFPDEIVTSYSDVLNWLLNMEGMQNFDAKWLKSLDYFDKANELENWKGAGREFSQLLPSHSLKAYKLFLQIERDHFSEYTETILDQPTLHIIDNGCGGGSVTIGLICLLINYQKFKLDNCLPITSIKLNCFGVDPNLMVLQIYERFIAECSKNINKYLIEVDTQILPGTLPDNIGEVLKWLYSFNRIHTLTVGFGNVIRPIKNQLDQTRGLLGFLKIKKGLFGNYGSDIGFREVTALRTLMDHAPIDQLILPIIGSDSTEKEVGNKKWDEEISSFQKNIRRELDHHNPVAETQKRIQISLIGPKDSYFQRIKKQNSPFTTDFSAAYLLINNHDFVTDSDWQKILTEDNLLLAWARVRNELSFFQIEDTIENRMFEMGILERIQKLRQNIFAYKWNSLNILEMLTFYAPKGFGKDPRPLNLCRLEEQILAVAILQVIGSNTLEFHHRSFAYRLSKKHRNEFLYEDWYKAHTQYIEEARKAAQKNPGYTVIRTDIESYYTKIRQDHLSGKLIHEARIYNSRVSDLARFLIHRQFQWEENLGIPQGHAMSGLLSNIYLSEIDKFFGQKGQFDIDYFRYVDDIIIICKPEEKDIILTELDTQLDILGLRLSKDENGKKGKTFILTVDEFLEETPKDDLLEAISKAHIELLREVYKLDDRHFDLSQENWWAFLQKYQAILSRLGVFISIQRLSRKIKANQSWWNRTFSFWKQTKLPYVSEMKDLDDIKKWVENFTDKNPEWMIQHEILRENLLKIFQEGLDVLKNSNDVGDVNNAQTKIKFSTYRLGQLGFGNAAESVAQLVVDNPWLINVRRILQSLSLQNREDLLLKIYSDMPGDKPEWQFIKSSVVKAFAELEKPSDIVVDLLSNIIVSDKSELEKTMASEVLILGRNIENPRLEKFQDNNITQSSPYLAKNLILLASKYKPEVLSQDIQSENVDILNEAIQFYKLKYGLEELYRHEPDILRDYYFGDYPDNYKEFRDPGS